MHCPPSEISASVYSSSPQINLQYLNFHGQIIHHAEIRAYEVLNSSLKCICYQVFKVGTSKIVMSMYNAKI